MPVVGDQLDLAPVGRPTRVTAEARVPRTGSVVRLQMEPTYNWGGSYRNERTGAGTISDNAIWGDFSPTLGIQRHHLEVIYVQSWAARKFIDIPVDDAMIRWRSFDDKSDKMAVAEQKHHVRERIARALRSGRLMGTGLLLLITKEAPLEKPLNMNKIREGDLMNLMVVDRFRATIKEYDKDMYSPTFCQPLTYTIYPPDNLESFDIDASRVLRFDGIEPPSGERWDMYEEGWGIPILVPVMTSIMQDSALTSSIAHLSEEASVALLKMQRFNDVLSGERDPDRPSPMSVIEANMRMKSNYRTVVIDAEDDLSRLDASFDSLPELMDRFAQRLAAAADIPATRFWGQSPLGMNATGEGEMRNYASLISALQRRWLDEPLSKLDELIAKDAGIKKAPPYRWASLLDLSDMEKLEITQAKVEVIGTAIENRLIDETEGRETLSGDDFFGELKGKPNFDEEEEEDDFGGGGWGGGGFDDEPEPEPEPDETEETEPDPDKQPEEEGDAEEGDTGEEEGEAEGG